MGYSTNIGTYADVREVLDQAIAAGGARYVLDSQSAVTRWIHRAYRFRSLLMDYKQKELAHFPGMIPSTPYDILIIRKKEEGGKWYAEIEVVKAQGNLLTLTGKPIGNVDEGPSFDIELEDLRKEVLG